MADASYAALGPGYASWPEVAYRLRLLRTSRGWSLRYAQARTGVSNAYLSQLESGTASTPSLEKLLAICSAYGVGLDDLLGEATPDWTRAWHRAVETACVLLGLPGGLNPAEFVNAVKRYTDA